MPIFDQGYQHWRGRLAGHAWRWLAIARQGVRQQTRRRRTLWFVAFAFLPALVLAATLAFWGLLEQQSSLLAPFMFMIQGLPEELRSGPKAFRTSVWTLAFESFLASETFFAMLLVLTVGPDLVSQDLRFNAVPLYLSRPLRRVDYFLGKLGVIAAFLVTVAVFPAVAAYALGLAFSMDLTVVRDTWRVLAGSVAYGVVVVASAGTLMLAISSLSRSSRLVGAAWVALWMIGNVASAVLVQTAAQDWCPLVSYTTNLERVRGELLGTDAARQQFLDVFKKAQEQARLAAAARPGLLFGPRRKGAFAPPPPPPPPPPETPEEARRARRRRRRGQEGATALFETPDYLKYPWTWSAGVLGGLFVASAWTLSTRVKSLDRLK